VRNSAGPARRPPIVGPTPKPSDPHPTLDFITLYSSITDPFPPPHSTSIPPQASLPIPTPTIISFLVTNPAPDSYFFRRVALPVRFRPNHPESKGTPYPKVSPPARSSESAISPIAGECLPPRPGHLLRGVHRARASRTPLAPRRLSADHTSYPDICFITWKSRNRFDWLTRWAFMPRPCPRAAQPAGFFRLSEDELSHLIFPRC